MNFAEGEPSKRYCIRGKHVAIICGVVVAVGLIVGLSVGLTRSCDSSGDTGQDTTPAPSPTSTSALPPQDQDICPSSEDESGEWKNFRLPDFIKPVHYDLEVKPLMEEDRYTGTVTISVNLSQPTRHLWLHIRETRITKLPELRRPSGEQVPIQRCFEYKLQEFLVIQAKEELAATSGDSVYLLTMEFAGWLNSSLVGFYRTTYIENGQVKSIAATDHEPTDARKSFPCFDEPNKKATYNISIIHPKEYSALSNMPVETEEIVDSNWKKTTFKKSVPMSTYLVCFAVHQFTSIQRMSKSNKPQLLLRAGISDATKHLLLHHLDLKSCYSFTNHKPKNDDVSKASVEAGKRVVIHKSDGHSGDFVLDRSAQKPEKDMGHVDSSAMSRGTTVPELSEEDEGGRESELGHIKLLTELVLMLMPLSRAVFQEADLEMCAQMNVINSNALTVYVQPEQRETAEYAANLTKEIFDFFEEYFAMEYSLPKLDKIAIPDFGTGAMENWGLVTYRETNLLYDPEQSASSNQQRVASVIAHELVHQWFGNIVTMDWWDDLWLNEGFASYFEFFGVNHVEKDWEMLSQVLLEDVLPVQEADSLMSSHPVVVTVSTPAEITSVFDGISYSKGASILRMLEDWITPEKFRIGCQNYLQKFEFKNAKTSDFWQSLEEASNQPVREVMETWTSQMGYPVVTVKGRQQISQKRFLLDSRADHSQPPSPLNYTWNIPVKWAENGNPKVTVYNMSEKEGIALNPNLGEDVFLKINPDHIGFYRVNYEAETWDFIAETLSSNHSGFSSADRTSFIDDAFALARAHLLNYKAALNLTRYLRSEQDYFPWQRVISAITYIISMFEDDRELYPMIETYFQGQVKPIADSLGWQDTGNHITRLLRTSVLGFACKMGDRDALNNASQLFETWLQGKESIPVNLRLLVYRYGMQNSGNESSWNATLEKYLKTTLAQEKEKLLYGLASVKDVALLARYLEMIKDPSVIKTQDVFTVIRYISYNSYGKSMAWNWIQLNWDYLVDRFTLNDRYLGRIVTIAEPFNTELQLWQMQSFFAKYPNAGAGAQPREQVLETVKNNIEWLKQNRKSISEWFNSLPKAA